MLNLQEFARLQKLCCLSLSPDETQKLSGQISSIVGFLSALTTLNVDIDLQQDDPFGDIDHSLALSSGVLQYPDTDALFRNVQHEILNRSIVIKSVVED